ncbi:hypothetical protein BHM03_00060250 [Ensete ventricosum]|nr:hypothetical protein BHM03_00060250 [Ensete ventricosum]
MGVVDETLPPLLLVAVDEEKKSPPHGLLLGGREKEEEEEEEEENMEISSPNPSRDPSPAADFFSLGGEKEQGDVSSRVLLPTRMRRSRRRFPTFLVALDEEKTAMKKSSPHVVLLIRGAVPRFFGRRHLR